MSGGRVQLGPNFDRLTGKRRTAENRYVRTPRSKPAARRTAFHAQVSAVIREHRRAYGEQCGCTVCVLARWARQQGDQR